MSKIENPQSEKGLIKKEKSKKIKIPAILAGLGIVFLGFLSGSDAQSEKNPTSASVEYSNTPSTDLSGIVTPSAIDNDSFKLTATPDPKLTPAPAAAPWINETGVLRE